MHLRLPRFGREAVTHLLLGEQIERVFDRSYTLACFEFGTFSTSGGRSNHSVTVSLYGTTQPQCLSMVTTQSQCLSMVTTQPQRLSMEPLRHSASPFYFPRDCESLILKSPCSRRNAVTYAGKYSALELSRIRFRSVEDGHL